MMQAVVIFFSITRLEWPWEGHYLNWTRVTLGARMQPLSKLSPGSLLKSGLGLLAGYCTHQETISGRTEQVYVPFDQDWNDLGRGHYFSRTRINAGRPKCGH